MRATGSSRGDTRRRLRAESARNLPTALPTAALSAALVALAVGATGCSGDPASAPAASASATASDTPPVMQDATSALQSLALTACPSGRGRLTATGSVRNDGRATADFVVTATWLDGDAGIAATASTVLPDVPAGGTATWKASATPTQAAASCTTRVSRGRLP